jgi:hypothetical protein
MSRDIMQQALDALTLECCDNDGNPVDLKQPAIAALEEELAKQEFYPDWDMLQPYHERIKELEAELAKPEQELRKEWIGLTDDDHKDFANRTKLLPILAKTLAEFIEAKLKEKNI